MAKQITSVVTIHGIGFEQPPQSGRANSGSVVPMHPVHSQQRAVQPLKHRESHENRSRFTTLTLPGPCSRIELARREREPVHTPLRVTTSTHCAEVALPGTAAYEEALRLQMELYRQVTRSGSRAIEDIVHFSPRCVTLIAMYRLGCDLPICTVKVVRPPETLIQSMVHFQPGSPSAAALDAGQIAELGGFVIRPGVERSEIPDLLDALALALLHLTDPAIASFWLLPRRHLMRLFRAEIQDLLPSYRIELCQDALGWNESGTLVHAMRETRFKGHHFGLEGAPYLYTISRQVIEQDLARRMASLQDRKEHPAFPALFHAAMRKAQHDLEQELALLNNTEGNSYELL